MISFADAIGIAAILNGVGLIYMAYRQNMVAESQKELAAANLRADLFDRRFAVFQLAQKVLSHVMKEAACDYSHVHEFTPAVQQAYFLFDDQVYDYLLEVRSKLITMASTTKQLENFYATNRQEVINENTETLNWLVNQLDMDESGLFPIFRPYLKH